MRTPEYRQELTDSVVTVCARAMGVAPGCVQRRDRRAPVATARQMAMWIMRNAYEFSWSQIGLAFKRNMSTCIHACEETEWKLRHKPWFCLAIKVALAELGFSENVKIPGEQEAA